jgi:hypothetical protein
VTSHEINRYQSHQKTNPAHHGHLPCNGWLGRMAMDKKYKNVAWFSFNVDRVPQFFKWIKRLVVKGIIDSLKF